MPTYSIEGPEGQTYSIDGPEGATREQIIAAIQARLAERPDPITRESTALEEAARGLTTSARAKLTGVQTLLGDDPNQAILDSIAREEELARSLGVGPSRQRIVDIAETEGIPKAVVEGAGDIPRTVASQSGVFTTMGLGGRTGAALTPIPHPGAKAIGAGIGAIVALVPDLATPNMQRQVQTQMENGEEVNVDVGGAYKTAFKQAALEAGGTAIFLGKSLVRGALGLGRSSASITARHADRLRSVAERTKLGRTTRGLGRGSLEMPVEMAQQVLERDFAGLDLTSDEAFEEYWDAAYLGFLVGGSLGVTGSFADTLVAQQAVRDAPITLDAANAALEEELNTDTPPSGAGAPLGTAAAAGAAAATADAKDGDAQQADAQATADAEGDALGAAAAQVTADAEAATGNAAAQAAAQATAEAQGDAAAVQTAARTGVDEEAAKAYAKDIQIRREQARQEAGRLRQQEAKDRELARQEEAKAQEDAAVADVAYAEDIQRRREEVRKEESEKVEVTETVTETVAPVVDEVVDTETVTTETVAPVVDEVVDEVVDTETVTTETTPSPLVPETAPNPLLTREALTAAGISKAGLKSKILNKVGTFPESIGDLELTNENLARQQEALTAYAATKISKKQKDIANAAAANIAEAIETRGRIAESGRVLDEEGNVVSVQDIDVVEGDIDPQVAAAEREETATAAADPTLTSALPAEYPDIQILQTELATNPDSVISRFIDPNPTVASFISKVMTANETEASEISTWIQASNLSKKTKKEYIDAKIAVKKMMEEIVGYDLPLLLGEVSPLAPPVSPAVIEALEQGNLAEALAALRADQGRRNKDVRRLIDALAKAIGTTTIELRNNPLDEFGRPVAGYFSPRTNTIVLNDSVAISTHTLLHESFHAVGSHMLEGNTLAARQMRTLFEEVRGQLDTAYGAKNLQEFFAEALSNPEFRAKLGGIKAGNKGTALQRFFNAVKNMLRTLRGLPTKPLDSVQSRVDSLMDELISPAPEFRDAADMYLANTSSEYKTLLTGTLQGMAGTIPGVDYEVAGDYLGKASSTIRSKALSILSLDSIAKVAKREFPTLSAAIDALFSTINQKRGGRNIYLAKIRGTAQEIKGTFKESPKSTRGVYKGEDARQVFSKLATETTRLGYDPTLDVELYTAYYFTYFDPESANTGNRKRESEPFATKQDRDAAMEQLKKDKPELVKEKVLFVTRDPETDAAQRLKYVKDMYDSLSPAQQRAYETMRDAYAEVFEDLKTTLLNRINEIDADPALKADVRNQLLYEILYKHTITPYFPLSRKGDLWISYNGVDPYTQGVGRYKETFTNEVERQARIRELNNDPILRRELEVLETPLGLDTRDIAPNQEFGGDILDTGFAYSLLGKVKAAGVTAAAEAEQQALSMGDSPAQAEEVKTSVLKGRVQLEKIVLEAIVKAAPERSLLRTFQPRTGVLGYEPDAITTFEERMPVFTNQVNTLKWALPLEQAGNKIKEEAAKYQDQPNGKFATEIAQHMEKYIRFAQNPDISSASKTVKSLTFMWTLGFNVASAIVNLFILPTVVFAYLGGKYGYTKTMRHMIKNLGIYFKTGTSRPIQRFGGDPISSNPWEGLGLGNPNYNSPDLPEGLKDFEILSGVLIGEGYDNATTIADMLDADTPMLTSINNYMGWVFNQSERLNRHVTAMTSYELELEVQQARKGAPLTDDEKQQLAREAIVEAEYTNSGASIDTAPTISQNDIGSVAFMYKRFGVSMLFFQLRTFFDGLAYVASGGRAPTTTRGGRPLNPEEQTELVEQRLQAVRQGAMLFATVGLLAGAQGMPGMNVIRQLFNKLKDDDDEDFDSALKGWLGGQPVFYEGIINEITGADIAPRIAMNEMLWRSMPNQAEQSMMEDIGELLGGPALSILGKTFGENGAIELWKDGQEQNRPDLTRRALERMLPPALANPWRAGRYYTAGGARNLRGDFILEDVTTGGLIGQFLGFAPAGYTRQLEQNARDKAIDMAISTQKTTLLGRLNFAKRFGLPDKTVEMDINEFNLKHPETAITQDTRERSWNSYSRTNVAMGQLQGVSINPQRQYTVLMERLNNADDNIFGWQ